MGKRLSDTQILCLSLASEGDLVRWQGGFWSTRIEPVRANGVRAIIVWCEACGHHADVNVDDIPGDVLVPQLARGYRCSACGSRQVSTRPA